MFLLIDSKVEKYHGDALKNWSQIVELAKKCTVIFNNIDVGAYFDYATLSLAKSLGIPYAAGSSYCRLKKKPKKTDRKKKKPKQRFLVVIRKEKNFFQK